MVTFVTIIHVLLCVFMIFIILLQPSKDAGMGTALGGGAATTAFGGRGAVTFLTKVTAVCAVLFFLTSLGLSLVGLKRSVVSGVTEPVSNSASAPVTPKAAGSSNPGASAPAAPTNSPSGSPPAEKQPASQKGAPSKP